MSFYHGLSINKATNFGRELGGTYSGGTDGIVGALVFFTVLQVCL